MSHRVEFQAEAIDRVLAFCAQHPGSDLPPELRRRLILRLCTTPRGVIELRAQEGAQLIGVVIDAIESVADCAVFELLGVRPGPGLDLILAQALVEAEQVVRAGPRQGIEVPVQPPWSAWEPILVSRGYRLAFASHELSTPPMAPPEERPLPGPQWRWAPALPEQMPAYHQVVCAAMAPVPGAYLGTLAEFRVARAEREPDILLMCGERIAGFAYGSCRPGGRGAIHQIGRHPDFRGHGLGALLLVRLMRHLATRGADHYELDVTASNHQALALYRSFGFALIRRVPVYRQVMDPGED